MDSRIYLAILLTISGCSNGDLNTSIVGTRLDGQTGLYNDYGMETKNIFVVDAITNRLLGINSETMAIDHEFELTNPSEQHYVTMDRDEKFVIDFSTKHIQVINLDGERYDSSLKFMGTPVSAAYDASARLMIMQDDLGSIGILKFAVTGEILDSWLGGPLVSDGKIISAGDLGESNQLILAMSDGSVTLVDLEATLAQKSWQYENFATNKNAFNWVAPDATVTDKVLVASSTALSVLDLATKNITETIALPQQQLKSSQFNYRSYEDNFYYTAKATSSSTVGISKAGKPHAVVQTSANQNPTLYYIGADGSLKSHILQNATNVTYLQSYLSQDTSEFMILIKTQSNEVRALGVRLSDNLVVHSKTISKPRGGSVRLNQKLVFVNYETGLGRVDLHNIVDDSTKTLEAYNFDYLRNR